MLKPSKLSPSFYIFEDDAKELVSFLESIECKSEVQESLDNLKNSLKSEIESREFIRDWVSKRAKFSVGDVVLCSRSLKPYKVLGYSDHTIGIVILDFGEGRSIGAHERELELVEKC